MDKFLTPDQSMRREQVEEIVKTNAPKAYASLGLDRLLTTAQMVEEYRLANLDVSRSASPLWLLLHRQASKNFLR